MAPAITLVSSGIPEREDSMAAEESDMDDELEQFLNENFEEEVRKRFLKEKIDKATVLLMSDKQLEDCGVTAMGDRLRLRSFCKKRDGHKETGERRQKIEKMKELLNHQKPLKRSFGRQNSNLKEKKQLLSQTKCTFKFEFGWKHWCQSSGMYKQKKKQSGGGTRVWEVGKNASVNDCLEIAIKLFFPYGSSSEGLLDEMDLKLANFNGDSIDELDENGQSLPFTAERYKIVTGFTKPRVYLLSKAVVSCDSDSDSEVLLQPVFLPRDNHQPDTHQPDTHQHDAHQPDNHQPDAHQPDTHQPDTHKSDNHQPDNHQPNTHQPDTHQSSIHQSQLIGTSGERKDYRDQLERDLAASLQQDRAKEDEKRRKDDARLLAIDEKIARAEVELKLLEALRLSRLARVPPEPHQSEDHVIVRVRHLSLGIMSRRFSKDSTMSSIYDWVGSLSCTPKYFTLSTDPKSALFPHESVGVSTADLLCMVEVDNPLALMEDDNDVSFYGGQLTEDLDNTLPDNSHSSSFRQIGDDTQQCDDASHSGDQPYRVPAVEDTLPDVIMEEDNPILGDPTLKEWRSEAHYNSLDTRRRKEAESLEANVHLVVSRQDAMKELLHRYKEDTDLTASKFTVSFEQEDGSGDGLVRELYSLFWESFISHNCEGSTQFTLCVSPNFSSEDYTAVGRLITHMFIQCGSFPVKLAKACFHQALFGCVEEDCLLESFLNLLPPTESDLISGVIYGKKPLPLDEVLDILDEYKERTFPTSENLRALLVKIATAEFVTKPFFPLLKIREGMGRFWDSATKDEINSLYELCSPSPGRVIDLLHIVPLNSQEAKAGRWLRRYLREVDTGMLGRFLRFCTATEIVIPGSKLKVRFENMPSIGMRPIARTCFKILTLPRNYATYHQLKENLDFYLRDPSQWDLEDVRPTTEAAEND